jgi:hypothetical protein
MTDTASAAHTGPERKLVAIEIQKELDVFSKKWEDRIFVKLYVAARTSGLLAAMSDRDWKTLCTLATFMDKHGRCYPSQAGLARALGINRGTANERVRSLAQFRFQGKPVLLIDKHNRKTKNGTRFASNRYTILPVTKLGIFDGNDETARRGKQSPVSAFPDTGSSDAAPPDTGEPDTNNK